MEHRTRQPRSLEGYQILSTLGYGQRSVIYAVAEEHTNRLFALKHVVRRRREDWRVLEQAINEYKISSQLKHPVLRKCYKLKRIRKFVQVSEILLLMELFDGVSMEQERPASITQLIKVFRQVAEALASMHSQGFAHADVKPNNILLGAGGQVRLIDFGQSCPIGSVKQRIQGTPDFIAPEQVLRRPIDQRTDAFNLGATMYWALTEKKVPTAIRSDQNQRILLKEQAQLKEPAELNPNIPKPLSKLVLDCCRTEPRNRPASMLHIIARLDVAAQSLQNHSSNRPNENDVKPNVACR